MAWAFNWAAAEASGVAVPRLQTLQGTREALADNRDLSLRLMHEATQRHEAAMAKAPGLEAPPPNLAAHLQAQFCPVYTFLMLSNKFHTLDDLLW